MRCAVLQTSLCPPDFELLRRAFRHVPGLTPYDANILGRDAFGVLVKDFTPQQAAALQGALRTEGIETEIVDQSLLPPLPPAKLVNRLECRPEHLLIFDPLGRSFPLEWRHVLVIAAGSVQLTEFIRREERRPVTRYTAGGHPVTDIEVEAYNREEQSVQLMGEVVITGGALRYSFRADKFIFAALGDRATRDPRANFAEFVRGMIQCSPHAGLNRGAAALHSGEPIFSYPSRNAFHEELVWMLWQIRKAS